jgi:hypothetical protein
MAGSNQRRRQWETRIARWRASGASMAAYCRQHGLSYAAFVWWRRRFERTVTPSPLTLIPVVAPISSGGAITIRLPSGIGIEVESGFDAGVLSAVVRTLQVAPPC